MNPGHLALESVLLVHVIKRLLNDKEATRRQHEQKQRKLLGVISELNMGKAKQQDRNYSKNNPEPRSSQATAVVPGDLGT